MASRASPSVRVFYLSPQQVIEKLKKAMTRLMEMHPEIERVLLFGSLSRGEAVPGSDADVLLVLRDCALPFEKRGGHCFPRDAGIGVDVFAYTRAELDVMRASGHAFVIQALRESTVLVAREAAVF